MTSTIFLIIPMLFGVCFSVRDGNKIDNSHSPCYTDRDCAETDYCTRNKICYPCFSCEGINQERGDKRCAKGPQDCGGCISGYTQSTYTGLNRKRICTLMITIAEPMTSDDRIRSVTNPETLVAVVVLGFLTTIAFVSWHYYRIRSIPVHDSTEMELGSRTHCADGASVPPPSYEDIQCSENGSVAYSFQLRITEHPEKQTTAIPFQLPLGENVVTLAQPSQENSNAINETISSVSAEETETIYSIPILADVHDESTQPSTWTPGAAYLMVQDETDGAAKDQKVSPPNKRRKTDEKEKR